MSLKVFSTQPREHSNVLKEPKICNIPPTDKALSYLLLVAAEFFSRRKNDVREIRIRRW